MAKGIARKRPKIVIIAGPNGAGKTTFAGEFLVKETGFPEFINADSIARGLSPFAPEKAALQAGKVMLAEIERRVESRKGRIGNDSFWSNLCSSYPKMAKGRLSCSVSVFKPADGGVGYTTCEGTRVTGRT